MMKEKDIKMNQQKIKEIKEQSYIQELAIEADEWMSNTANWRHITGNPNIIRDCKFAELIVKECIDRIESYRIPCGNSPSGEMACEWTYDALKSIRDDIKETFGIE